MFYITYIYLNYNILRDIIQAGDDNMLIGLMGKSGSGKTTIGEIFNELDNSIKVIDVDRIGHESYADPNVKEKLAKYFPDVIFNADSTVNRKILSDIVFNDGELMKKLCNITLGFMENRIEETIKGKDIVILDYALLPKTKFFDMCDLKILVVSPYDKRRDRVIARDSITDLKFGSRESSSLNYNPKDFDYVIENNFDINYLRKVIGEIYEKSIVSR